MSFRVEVVMARARLLVADDNQAMHDILTSTLVDEFDVIRAVSDGGAALAAATASRRRHSRHFRASPKWDRSDATNKGCEDQCRRSFLHRML
jgi:CheY-like chemotaxis protein